MKEEDNNNKRSTNISHVHYQHYQHNNINSASNNNESLINLINKNSSVDSLKTDYMGLLPRAKIISANSFNSIDSNLNIDSIGTDYKLKTQTIGRYSQYQQQQPSSSSTNTQGLLTNHPHLQTMQKQNENYSISKPQNPPAMTFQQHQQQPNFHQNQTALSGFSSNTLPITKKEHQQQIPKNRQPSTVGLHQYQLNYITLRNALSTTQMKNLNETEGWALLCQSVQALQDLFLSGEFNFF